MLLRLMDGEAVSLERLWGGVLLGFLPVSLRSIFKIKGDII